MVGKWQIPTFHISVAMRKATQQGINALNRRFVTPRTHSFLLRSRSSTCSVIPARTRTLHVTASQQHLSTGCAPSIPTETYMTSPLTSHDKIDSPGVTPYFLNNQFIPSTTTDYVDVHDPATNNLITRVPQLTSAELQAAVDSAMAAFPGWRNTSVLARQQVLFRFAALIRENWDRLAASITLEQGKTFADARGDVLRGLQVAEAACGAPEFLKGEVLEVARDMETRSYREPLGVVAAICPFSE